MLQERGSPTYSVPLLAEHRMAQFTFRARPTVSRGVAACAAITQLAAICALVFFSLHAQKEANAAALPWSTVVAPLVLLAATCALAALAALFSVEPPPADAVVAVVLGATGAAGVCVRVAADAADADGSPLALPVPPPPWALALAPFAWQCVTSAYIIAFTDDDKRSAMLVLVGTWLFGAQVFPAASVIASAGGVDALVATRPGLVTVWTHSLLGLVWLLNWSTLGASMRVRRVIDDEGYRALFLLRPSAAWIALFALDVYTYRPFASIWEYFATAGGAQL